MKGITISLVLIILVATMTITMSSVYTQDFIEYDDLNDDVEDIQEDMFVQSDFLCRGCPGGGGDKQQITRPPIRLFRDDDNDNLNDDDDMLEDTFLSEFNRGIVSAPIRDFIIFDDDDDQMGDDDLNGAAAEDDDDVLEDAFLSEFNRGIVHTQRRDRIVLDDHDDDMLEDMFSQSDFCRGCPGGGGEEIKFWKKLFMQHMNKQHQQQQINRPPVRLFRDDDDILEDAFLSGFNRGYPSAYRRDRIFFDDDESQDQMEEDELSEIYKHPFNKALQQDDELIDDGMESQAFSNLWSDPLPQRHSSASDDDDDVEIPESHMGRSYPH